jgi:type VI secretion system protein VasG
MKVDASAEELIATRCTELERGARMVDALITNTLLPEIGQAFLTRIMNGTPAKKVDVSAAKGEFVFAYE